MNPISFTTEQFSEMTRVIKASIIEDSINALMNNRTVTIDNNQITELPQFIYWLLDNI